MRILITGGAGFVGSHLALAYRHAPGVHEVVAMDNLKRRGSELNLQVFRDEGIRFEHGDIRQPGDLADLPGEFDLMIEASAEPSVHAGRNGAPGYVLQSNLVGTLNCLEFARHRAGALIFLSTSRVYSIGPLRAVRLTEGPSRFEIAPEQAFPGVSERGINEAFPTHLPRSLYGATKLASELVIQEYADTYGLPAVINRCGVIAGPGQFGKVDQGVFTLWVARHHFRLPLTYTGFGGTGKQVRDLLHPDDLFALLRRQHGAISECSGEVYNIGGGSENAVSLLEYTELCREATGNLLDIGSQPDTSAVDVPLFVTDTRKAGARFDWRPRLAPRDIVAQIAEWIRNDETQLRALFT